MTPDDNMVIRYTAKELFGQVNDRVGKLGEDVNAKLDLLLEKVDAKADHAALVALVERVDTLEEDGRETKAVAQALLKEKASRWTRNEKLIGFGYAGFNIVLGIAALGPDLIHRWAG